MGENQGVNGINMMISICRDASEQWILYKDNDNFNYQLMDAIIKARKGVQRCHDNYQNQGHPNFSTAIRVSVLAPFDKLIPDHIKVEEGISLSKGARIRVQKISQSIPINSGDDNISINGSYNNQRKSTQSNFHEDRFEVGSTTGSNFHETEDF